MITFGGSSRQSLATLRGALDKAVSSMSASDCVTVSGDLFKALAIVNSSPALRRALTDPSRDYDSKAILSGDIFGKVVGGATMELLNASLALRWSTPAELAYAIEQIAVEAEAAGANFDGKLDHMQDELFAFGRIIASNGELRLALNTISEEAKSRQGIIDSLLRGKFEDATIRLLGQLVVGKQGRSIEQGLEAYSHAVAARKERTTAHVRSAIALSGSQREKLSQALSAQIGQPVHVNVEIDAKVLGGIAIRFGDEIIDGTIVSRLAEASRALVS